MSWKRRLIELALAGGVLGAGCGNDPGVINNNFPDPCSVDPSRDSCPKDLSGVAPPDMHRADLSRND